MYSLDPHYFNDFLLQTPEAGMQAFSDLMQVRTALWATNNATIKKMYKFLDLLYPVLSSKSTDNQLLPMQRMSLSFFDAALVKQFIANPLDPELLDAVTEQIILIASFNGTNPFTEDPFTSSEMALFMAEQLDYYTHDTMLATLRTTILGKDSLDNVPIIMTILSESAANYAAQPPTVFDWEAALVWAAMLHTVWFYFTALQTKDQELLVKFFFYQSIVAGVPVRDRLVEMFATDAAGEANQKWTYTLLNQSLELVPTTTNGVQLRPFSLVWGAAAGAFSGVSVTALAEDEQARKIYLNQTDRDSYSIWMREMFHIVHLLQQGKL